MTLSVLAAARDHAQRMEERDEHRCVYGILTRALAEVEIQYKHNDSGTACEIINALQAAMGKAKKAAEE